MSKKVKSVKSVESAPVANPVGAPSQYKPEFAIQLLEYFDIKPYEKVGDQIESNDMPTLAGFAIKLGFSRDTLHQWSKDFPEFSDAYSRAKDFQEHFLVTNGLKGLVNTNFGIFTAKNVLGWRDKQPGETDVVVNNVNALSDEDLDKKIAEKAEKLGKK